MDYTSIVYSDLPSSAMWIAFCDFVLDSKPNTEAVLAWFTEHHIAVGTQIIMLATVMQALAAWIRQGE